MTDHPILFQPDMVRAILDGRKTQVRRPMKDQPTILPNAMSAKFGWDYESDTFFLSDDNGNIYPLGKPPYQVGDELYCKETFASREKYRVAYKADGKAGSFIDDGNGRLQLHYNHLIVGVGDISKGGHWVGLKHYGDKWKPSTNMPKWAARIWQRVTGVRVEQDDDGVWKFRRDKLGWLCGSP